ncbi:MAG: hypothetical protein KGM42_08120 [Hyphomicrobiales bacterium]|nr:hypothetical protein [Hyphomicrobiales bacterium]
MTLASLLRARGLDPAAIIAHRNTLDPRDAGEGCRSIADLAATGHDLVYERMQNGRVFGAEARVLSFRGEAGGRARLAGFRRLVARRPGIAPGDIVYDYDVAHLLHDFISRAKHPIFYDAFDIEGLGDLVGKLMVQWPVPLMRRRLRADDARLEVVAF